MFGYLERTYILEQMNLKVEKKLGVYKKRIIRIG